MHLSQDQRIALFEAFATRAAALDASAWDRIAARSTTLEGPSFAALLRRARVSTRPLGAPLRRTARRGVARVIAALGTATIDVLGVVQELVAEFDRPDPAMPDRMATLAATIDDPHVRRHLVARATLERSLSPYEATHPGMATAVRAAGEAVSQYDVIDPGELTALYGVVEPEIPLAELQRAAGVVREAD